MVARTWLDAIEAVSAAMEHVTPAQLAVATIAEVTISDETPAIVAAAILRVRLCKELGLPSGQPIRESSTEWIGRLSGSNQAPVAPETQQEASAWVRYLFLARRRESLLELQLVEGDIVRMSNSGVLAELSSIGDDGRLHFKGGLGFGAWPDQVTVVARADDASVESQEARIEARNKAAVRRPVAAWSMAKRQDLLEHRVVREIVENDVSLLEEVISAAENERPIQEHLEANPHLLTAILRGNERFLLPQKRLGSQFIPDFIVGDVDSMGIHWLLVELETPRCGMYLTNGRTLGLQARKGVDQVLQWRNWLASNVAYARRPRNEGGLGLFDIKEKTRALVLVGRRAQLTHENDAARQELRQSSSIEVHSYDWLLESLRGGMSSSGPPASNPYVVRGDD